MRPGAAARYACNEILFLPLIGLFYGIRAMRRGRMIGGIVGIVFCALGGIITITRLVGGWRAA